MFMYRVTHIWHPVLKKGAFYFRTQDFIKSSKEYKGVLFFLFRAQGPDLDIAIFSHDNKSC